MAKSDSFFIRAKVQSDPVFNQTSIDLGAYVDALGKSVLRIHRVSVQYIYGNFANPNIAVAGVDGRACWQLTTQSQAALVDCTDKSVISSGQVHASSEVLANSFSFLTETVDINPEDWTNGYLVGVEQIYLGADASGWDNMPEICVMLECTVETLNSAAAMALALSQQ